MIRQIDDNAYSLGWSWHSAEPHINPTQEAVGHPNQRNVLQCYRCRFTRSGIARNTCGRRTHASTPEHFRCEFSGPSLVILSLLSILKISWGSCEIFGINSTDPNLQCGYLEVPMDYHDSSAGKARLAVARYAGSPSEKLGTLFFNPGDKIGSPFLISPLIHNPGRWTRTARSWFCCNTWTNVGGFLRFRLLGSSWGWVHNVSPHYCPFA